MKAFKPIKRVSAAMAARLAQYERIKDHWFVGKNYCEMCGGCFSKKGLQVHHVRGRLGALLCAVEFWKCLCMRCHRDVHDYPNISIQTGFLAPKGDWNKQP